MSEEFLTEINYDRLIEKSLKNVVIEALRIAEYQGLPGENHFYITFKTNYPHVKISDHLRSQYPDEMTIVIQHQYADLKVDRDSFSIELSFGGIPQTLVIPFAAITYFADPHAKFGLSFNIEGSNIAQEEEDLTSDTVLEDEKKASNGPATVVSIDAFRKKK